MNIEQAQNTEQQAQARRRIEARRMAMAARISDIGRAENQSVSAEVLEVAHEEIAGLQRDVVRLQTWHDNLKAAAAEKDDTIQSQSERIGDLVADVWRLEGQIQNQEHVYQGLIDSLTHRLENQETTIRVQAETIARLETEQAQTIEMLKDGNSAHVMILKGDVYVTRRQLAHLLGDAYQDLFNALENTPQNPLCPKEPPLAPETANVPDVPVGVHTAPQVRWAGGK